MTPKCLLPSIFVASVLALCASLRVPCVAEHIETEGQLALLRELGCRDGQGFALGMPMPAGEARILGATRVLPFGARKAAAP